MEDLYKFHTWCHSDRLTSRPLIGQFAQYHPLIGHSGLLTLGPIQAYQTASAQARNSRPHKH